jgi:hypothetical protein
MSYNSLRVTRSAEITVSNSGRFPAPIKIVRSDEASVGAIVSGALEIDHPADPLAHCFTLRALK